MATPGIIIVRKIGILASLTNISLEAVALNIFINHDLKIFSAIAPI